MRTPVFGVLIDLSPYPLTGATGFNTYNVYFAFIPPIGGMILGSLISKIVKGRRAESA